ncbi:MAG: serine hydrolase [Proteobacteria bacterium]|nr:serine hydrolase [Pseudomonadota bacterium]MBI3498112.1 serine hydrolase [Pseudomonadota bacterium]
MSLAGALESAFEPASAAVAAGSIPGAVLGVFTEHGKSAVRWAGHAMLTPERQSMSRATIFDLASLTKVIVTLTEIMRLVEAGKLDLDDPLSLALPDLHQYVPAAPVRGLTIRQCLTHQAGLPAVEPIYTWGSDAATLKTLVLQHDWPLGEHVYSDIGFILLGLVIERFTEKPLASLTLSKGLTFAPDPKQTAATENCQWRGRVMRGEVHDENAYALGGVAGHSGLFGTIDGVLGFAHALTSGKVLTQASLDEMLRPQSPTRGLAWQRRHAGWSGGGLCSAATLGHTGFTGTGLWIDFERGYAWALLTNRVHPSRHVETGIQSLRRAVGNRLAAAWPFSER